MRRRDYLRATGGLAVGTVSGCLGGTDDGSNEHVVLSEPERSFESADVGYPAWGQRIPDVTVPAPLEDRAVTVRDIDRPRLLTFFYTHCQTVCPVLISTLRNVQTHALNNGYGDAVAFLPVTFDPARDDADRLTQYAERMHVDADAGDWHFLRPDSPTRANQVVREQFGVQFDRQTPTPTGTATPADGGQPDDAYMFTHYALTLLVNADDYVERAYRTRTPDATQIRSDLRTVRNA